MKNNPLIDMCLASYKHGINETLDILNLYNVQGTVKNWKEPVSEDLEKAAKQYEEDAVFYAGRNISDFFKAGAKWQKEQDQSTIELAEDHAMLAGMEKMKEEMMAKAVEGGCFSYKNGFVHISCDVDERVTNIKFGDKVKVIVIKEDRL